MNDWMVPVEATARVREGVMRRVRRRKRVRRSLVGVACAVVAAVLAWPRMPEAEVLALRAPMPPAAPEVHFTPKPRVVVPVERPLLVAAAKRAEKITILTDDPDVIIVLVSDGDGGGD